MQECCFTSVATKHHLWQDTIALMQQQALATAGDPRDGSTLVLALLIPPSTPLDPPLDPPTQLLVAHVGDSVLVGCGVDGAAVRLTEDHAPDRVDEQARIQKAGGCVTRRSAHGVARLQVGWQ